MSSKISLFLLLFFSFAGAGAFAADHEEAVEKIADIPYAEIEGRQLLLDLYRPLDASGQEPLIVYVHGGAWRAGSKNSMPLKGLVREGFAVASVEYRLTPVARFPAQAHDIKAAIRFLRAEQGRYGYRADRVGIAGSSAGGHLAALVGVTNGLAELEGEVGEHCDQSSAVQAVVSYYGASNLTTILQQSTPHGIGVRVPALQLLLGQQPETSPTIAELASPVFHIDSEDPPLLLLHGDQDPQMPINQSHEMAGAYQRLGLPVHLDVVHGAGHGGAAFHDAERTATVAKFLSESLR